MPDPTTKAVVTGASTGALVTVFHSFIPYLAPAIWGAAGGMIAIAMLQSDKPYTWRTGLLRVLASAAVAAIATRGVMKLIGLDGDDVQTLIAGFLGIAAPVIVQWTVKDGWAWVLGIVRKMLGVQGSD